MTDSKRREVPVVLTDEHVRLLIEGHLLKAHEVADVRKMTAAVQELVDKALGHPQDAWHQWDDWAKGLE